MKIAGVGLLLLVGAGCAHVISEEVRQSVNPAVTFSALLESPEAYVGERVLFGGTIVRTRNLPDHSEIEVVQRPLDFTGYPANGDETGGRFLFIIPGYQESEVYAKGRVVTGAGTVTGSREGKIGESPYVFPVIQGEELFLWEKIPARPYYYPYYGYPFHHYPYHYPYHFY